MPLVSMPEILKDAKTKKYAVGCFNALNIEMVRGIIEACEEENSPVILCHAEVHLKYTSLEEIAPVLLNAATYAKVPVAVLLDHGKTFDVLIKAMKLGFNAVMYDGSSLRYEDNVANTREIIKIARAMGVSVEAELGRVPRPISGGAEGYDDDSIVDDYSLYTDPLKAEEFAEHTGVDALAVAIGTSHGIYLKTPKLDFEKLKEIVARVKVPLVMHGGSGLSDDDFKNSIHNGICKINYYTDMALKAARRIKSFLNEADGNVFYHNIMLVAKDSFKEAVKNTLRIFGSNGKA